MSKYSQFNPQSPKNSEASLFLGFCRGPLGRILTPTHWMQNSISHKVYIFGSAFRIFSRSFMKTFNALSRSLTMFHNLSRSFRTPLAFTLPYQASQASVSFRTVRNFDFFAQRRFLPELGWFDFANAACWPQSSVLSPFSTYVSLPQGSGQGRSTE